MYTLQMADFGRKGNAELFLANTFGDSLGCRKGLWLVDRCWWFQRKDGLKSPIFVMGPKPPTREYESWWSILEAFPVLCLLVLWQFYNWTGAFPWTNLKSMNASSWFRLSQCWKAEKHDQTARHGLQCNYYNIFFVTLSLSTVKQTDCSLIWPAGYSYTV